MASLGCPPCTLAANKKHMCQTFVAKMSGYTQTQWEQLRGALVVEGCYPSAQAVVRAGDFCPEPGLYLVLTTSQPRDFTSFAGKLKDAINTQCPTVSVDWVRALSVRLQRLFGWGDVRASTADVADACKRGDLDELKVLVPGTARLIDQDSDAALSLMPQLSEALRSGLPAIGDCAHQFDDESAQGPCARDPSHRRPFSRCAVCRTVLCFRCARNHAAQMEEQRDLQRALHEVNGSHTWQPASKHAECTVCNAMPAMMCHCGAQRCEKCLAPKVAIDAPDSLWTQSQDHPAPFYVADQQKVPDAEKLQWLKQELGADADLPTFSAKFVELFGERLHGRTPQKRACLDLYAKYTRSDNPTTASKESDLPPVDLEEFQKVWDPDAPNRCRECGKALAPDAPLGQLFCGMACQAAGQTFICHNCSPPLLKLPGEDPVKLLRQMVGDDAGLPVFVGAVRQLVTERQVAMPQKRTVLRLYAEYAPELSEARAWREEKDLPPSDLAKFQKAWGPVAPSEVVLRNGSRMCKVCGWGAESADRMARVAHIGPNASELGKCIKRNAESLQVASNVWDFSAVRGPDHQPAWRKRRRS